MEEEDGRSPQKVPPLRGGFGSNRVPLDSQGEEGETEAAIPC